MGRENKGTGTWWSKQGLRLISINRTKGRNYCPGHPPTQTDTHYKMALSEEERPTNRNGIKRTTVFALDFSSWFSKTYSWIGPENITPSTAILCSTIYELCSKQCWHVAKVANTTRANLFCFSFVKSEPTGLHPEELKFEAKDALLWYKYWQHNQMQCVRIQAQTNTMQCVKI